MTSSAKNRVSRVLIVVAGRHGATRQIADALGGVLRGAGLDVDVWDAEGAPDPAGYDAAVLGSAVYYGKWLPSARAYADTHGRLLADRPVWLFSSGPVGDPLEPDGIPADVEAVRLSTGARGHVVFGGRIDRSRLGRRERAVTRVVGATEGDFRDWGEIASWALRIAAELQGAAVRQ